MNKEKTVIKVEADNSKNVIESVIFTRSHSSGNVYRQRFLLRIVELAQQVIRENMDIVTAGGKIQVEEFGLPLLTMPVRSILSGEEDKNYEKAKRAVLDYLDWKLIFEDDKKFKVTQVIYEPELDKENGKFQFLINKNIWRYLVDFTKGYSQYDLDVALTLNSQLALEIYKGLPNQKGTLTYSLERFREVYGFQDKYKDRPSNLVKYAIEPAKRELDRKSPWTFEYVLHFVKKEGGKKGRRSISGIDIIPVRRVGNESDDVARKRVHPAQLIGSDAYKLLTEKLFFTFAEIKANIKLFELGSKNLGEAGFADWINKIVPDACRAERSTQGYVVNALKKYLDVKFGIKYKKSVERVKEVFVSPTDVRMDENVVKKEGNTFVPVSPSNGSSARIEGVKSIGDVISSFDMSSLFGPEQFD